MGFETSLTLARNGSYTYATMRKLEDGGSKQITDITKNENLPLQVIQLDVNNDKSVTEVLVVRYYKKVVIVLHKRLILS
jgi:hypothetical protein